MPVLSRREFLSNAAEGIAATAWGIAGFPGLKELGDIASSFDKYSPRNVEAMLGLDIRSIKINMVRGVTGEQRGHSISFNCNRVNFTAAKRNCVAFTGLTQKEAVIINSFLRGEPPPNANSAKSTATTLFSCGGAQSGGQALPAGADFCGVKDLVLSKWLDAPDWLRGALEILCATQPDKIVERFAKRVSGGEFYATRTSATPTSSVVITHETPTPFINLGPQTATSYPNPTIVVTPTAEATPTAEPKYFSADSWARKENEDMVNPALMYPVVGAVDMRHRKFIDLKYLEMKVAYDTKQDLTKIKTHSAQRANIVDSLQNNDQLKLSLERVRSAIYEIEQNGNGDTINYENFTLVVENGKVTQVVYRDEKKDKSARYKVIEDNGKVVFNEDKNYALLPELRVNGAHIERTDNVEGDKRIQFKGANITTFQDVSQSFNESGKFIDTANKWGVNFVRFIIDIGKVNLVELDKTIKSAEQKGMYVLLSPWGKNGKQTENPTNETHDFIVNLAKKYKGKSNVMYEVLNEIGDFKDEEWLPNVVKNAQDIQSANPDAKVFLPGAIWNRNMSAYQRNPVNLSNIIYDVHYYAEWKGSGPLYNFEFLFDKAPVLIGEGGARVPYREDVESDTRQINNMINFVDAHPYAVHWAFFAMAPGTYRTSIFNPDGSIHPTHGKPFVDSLINQSSPSKQTILTN